MLEVLCVVGDSAGGPSFDSLTTVWMMEPLFGWWDHEKKSEALGVDRWALGF